MCCGLWGSYAAEDRTHKHRVLWVHLKLRVFPMQARHWVRFSWNHKRSQRSVCPQKTFIFPSYLQDQSTFCPPQSRHNGRKPHSPPDGTAVPAVDQEDTAQSSGDPDVRGLAHQHHDGLYELHKQHARLQKEGFNERHSCRLLLGKAKLSLTAHLFGHFKGGSCLWELRDLTWIIW